MDMIMVSIIDELERAIKELKPPFLGLPEEGHTAETLAYRRGARDAYTQVLETLRCLPLP